MTTTQVFKDEVRRYLRKKNKAPRQTRGGNRVQKESTILLLQCIRRETRSIRNHKNIFTICTHPGGQRVRANFETMWYPPAVEDEILEEGESRRIWVIRVQRIILSSEYIRWGYRTIELSQGHAHVELRVTLPLETPQSHKFLRRYCLSFVFIFRICF